VRTWSAEAGDELLPLVVMVHGAMDRSASMLKLSRRLDQRYRVLRYDRRGYGHSAPHPGPFDMAGQVADLVGLLGGRRAVVIGHSYGGNVALATAARHRDLVAGVVVYETPLSWEPTWPASSVSSSMSRDVDLSKKATGDAAEAFMRRLLGDERWLALPERTRTSRRSEGLALVNELRDLREHRPWVADEVEVPLVVGYGSRAGERYRKGMTHVANSIAQATLVCLHDCGHDAPTAAPDQFRRELIEPLLQRVGPPWADG
jgi:pimeloyl-ACP methyl ester carboxylesterase